MCVFNKNEGAASTTPVDHLQYLVLELIIKILFQCCETIWIGVVALYDELSGMCLICRVVEIVCHSKYTKELSLYSSLHLSIVELRAAMIATLVVLGLQLSKFGPLDLLTCLFNPACVVKLLYPRSFKLKPVVFLLSNEELPLAPLWHA